MEAARQKLIIAAVSHKKNIASKVMPSAILKGVDSIDEDRYGQIVKLLERKKFDNFNQEIFRFKEGLYESINLTYAKRIIMEDKINKKRD